MSVHETIKNIHTLNGQIVRVTGYLGECGGYDCTFFENKREHDVTRALIAAAQRGERVDLDLMADGLGISAGHVSGNDVFENDVKAAPFTNGYVVITARVDASCRDSQLRLICTDRSPELKPLAFDSWTPTTGNRL